MVGEKSSISPEKKELFFRRYENVNPVMILILMTVSLGLYFVNWLFFMNQKLEDLDEDAPDSKRAFVILLLFPAFWMLFTIVLDKLMFPENFIVDLITSLGWSIIIFLSLNYIYEFCLSFGKLTDSSALVWYLSIYAGYFSIVLFFMGFFYLIFLLFFPIVTVPAMQAMINSKSKVHKLRNTANYFNIRARVQDNT